MNKRTLFALLALALLGACAHKHPARSSTEYHRQSERPQVSVDAERRTITVEPAILTFHPEQKDIEIVWSLPANGKFRFVPEVGIVIEGEVLDKVVQVPDGIQVRAAKPGDKLILLDKDQKEITNCAIRAGGLQYVCKNRHSRPGVFKYSIRVTDGSSPPIERDPPMVNW